MSKSETSYIAADFLPSGQSEGEVTVLPPTGEHDPLPAPLGAMTRPVLRRRAVPDIAAVLQDLYQLGLDNVSPDKVMGLASIQMKEAERVLVEGYKCLAGGETYTGIQARAKHGLEKLIMGAITLHDPEWIAAMHQVANYLNADDPEGEHNGNDEESPDGF